jgi:hypothetical protein
MPIAILLMLAGLLGPAAAFQWRRNRWLQGGQWLVRHLSVHAAIAAPMAGAFVSALGLSIIWPPGIVPAFLAASAFVAVLVSSARRGGQHAAASPRVAPPRARRPSTPDRPDTRRPPQRTSRSVRPCPRPWPARGEGESRAG